MAIYMKYGDVKGIVTAEGFKDWIEVGSFQWGVGRGISAPVGQTTDREASTPSVSEITVTKTWDTASSSLLFQEALIGEGVKAEFKFTTVDAKKPTTFLHFELEGAMISGYSISSGGDKPSESLSINFLKVTYAPTEVKSAGGSSAKSKVTYDLGKAVTT